MQEYGAALSIRQALGRPSKEETSDVLAKLLPELRSTLRSMIEDRSLFEEGLKRIKSMYPDDGTRPSLPILTVEAIRLNTVDQLERYAGSALAAGRWPVYRFCFDFTQGFGQTTSVVALAEERIRQGREGMGHVIVEGLRHFRENVADVEDINFELENFLSIDEESKKAAALLIQDPRGFLLIDNYVEDLKNDKKDLPFFSKQYIVAGGEVARDIYKLRYKTVVTFFAR